MEATDLQKIAKDMLNDKEKFKKWADSNDLTLEAAKLLLQKLSESPEVSKEAIDYFWSDNTSSDLKNFEYARQQGRKEGHNEGFAKGIAIGAGVIALGVLAFFGIKNSSK